MAAYSTGSSWSFQPAAGNPPGSWGEPNEPAESHARADPHTQPESQTPKPRQKHYPPRTCRICLEVVEPTFHGDEDSAFLGSRPPTPRVTYESEDGGRLMSPCKCKGSQKYVHEDCLGAWRRSDPTRRRNYWECPTCRYRYRLERLTWSSWISSTSAQIALTMLIFIAAVFLLGFVADPIINMYIDPINTITTVGGPTGSLIYEGEAATWSEHFVKGLASLGLLGFAKLLLSLSPVNMFRTGGGVFGRRAMAGNGRDRLAQISWITLAIGIVTFLWAVWKAVRAWSRKTLQQAGDRVMDVPGAAADADDESAH